MAVRAAIFAVVSGVVSALALAFWPQLIGSFNTAGDFVALFLLSLAFAAAPIAVATIAAWNVRPAWFHRAGRQLILWSAVVAAVCGGLVGMLDTPASLRLVPVAALSGALGGIAGCAVLRIAERRRPLAP